MSNVTIKKICKICIITILAICVLVITFISVGVIVIICIITENEGKLNNAEKISTAVAENQETLQNIVFQVLDSEKELDIMINIKKKEYTDYSDSRDKELFNLEDIYRLSEELEIQEIVCYKDSAVKMVIFVTYLSGIVGSSDEKGFFYLEGGLPEDIFEYNYATVYRIYEYSEITDNWYYYNISY